MAELWTELLLVGGLVLLNAAFAGSEMALVTLREPQLARLERRSAAGRRLATLARDPNRFLATIQIGITLAGFLASATAAVSLAEPLVQPLDALGRAAEPVAVLLVTMVLTFVTLVVGELAPKRVAMQRAERWGLLAAPVVALLSNVSRPLVWLLGKTSDLLVRLAGVDPAARGQAVTEEELRDMVALQPELTPQERVIISGAFELADRTVRQILVPRGDVLALPAEKPAPEALRALIDAGHSRAPVYRGNLDHILGVVHLRNLVDATGSVEDATQQALVLPETLGALDALRELQSNRQQLAVVVDEYGGTRGVLTVEDLMEELVGEIWDEADRDVAAINCADDGSVTLPGSFPMHDLIDLGIDLPEGDYTTIAGLLLHRLGRLPHPGEVVEAGPWRIQTLEVTPRRVLRVWISGSETAAGHA